MKKRKTAFLANSWIAKTEEKVLSRGKVFLVIASDGSEVAMEMIGKWKVVEIKVRGFCGVGESGEHIRDEVLGPFYMLNRKIIF